MSQLPPNALDRELAEATQRLGTTPSSASPSFAAFPLPDSVSVRSRDLHDDCAAPELPDDQVIRAVKKHLIPDISGSPDLTSHMESDSSVVDYVETGSPHNSNTVTSVTQLQGGDITHNIYKWTESMENAKAKKYRSQSFSLPRSGPEDPTLANIRAPGGFRRHYLLAQARDQGRRPPNFLTRTFADFLTLYGHFGGEDLSDEEGWSDEEDEDEDEEAVLGRYSYGTEDGAVQPMDKQARQRHRHEMEWERRKGKKYDERAPLLRQSMAHPEPVQGNATPSKAVFLLLKSFVGTGVMFLPKAFSNGGIVFSTAIMVLIAVISLYTFLLLVKTREKVPASFGDIGGILFGPKMRAAVLTAITISQIGFVCAYMGFVAQNFQALIAAVTHCRTNMSITVLILAQLLIFVPLAMIRKISKLSIFALIADVFILAGLVYLYYYDFLVLFTRGPGPGVVAFNPKDFALLIGTAVFTFEGVGLVIPITESMKEPHKFPKVLTGTMIFITILFTSMGAISYLAFGQKVQTVILLNLPPTDPLVNVIQFLYSTAICLSIPLQLFPAIRIVETALFTRSGKYNQRVKWEKNLFRFASVMACCAIAIGGANDLDKFVSLVGALACIPLCFIFPPLFHWTSLDHKALYHTFIDWAIIIFGFASMIFSTWITLSQWGSEGGSEGARCDFHGNTM